MKFSMKPRSVIVCLAIASSLIHSLTHAATPAEKIAASDAPMLSCQFSTYPWYISKTSRSTVPKLPLLYYPHNGEMVELQLQFQSPSRYKAYTGPETLTFYQKIPPTKQGEEPSWRPVVKTKLDAGAAQSLIFVDLKESSEGISRGVPLRTDTAGSPPGSISFVNVSQVPVIVMAASSKYRVKPYGHFMHRFEGREKGKLSVKAATVVDQEPRLILNRNFIMTDTKRVAYFAFPTADNLNSWATTKLFLDTIPRMIAEN